MTNLKNSKCDKTTISTQIVKKKNAKNQIMTKLTLWQMSKLTNLNSNKTSQLKFVINSKTHIVTKLKSYSYNSTSKEKNFNCILLRTT